MLQPDKKSDRMCRYYKWQPLSNLGNYFAVPLKDHCNTKKQYSWQMLSHMSIESLRRHDYTTAKGLSMPDAVCKLLVSIMYCVLNAIMMLISSRKSCIVQR